MVGGMGPSPTKAKLLRLSSERKAAHREEKGYAEERKRALAKFEEQWGPVSTALGANKRKKPGRAELMETYGPGGSKRDKATTTIAENVDDNSGSAAGDADDIASRVASVAGSDGARAAADGDD